MDPVESKLYSPIQLPPPPTDRPPRIIICAVQIPFVRGGAESHIESLHRELVSRDYEVDVVRLPLKWYPVRQILNDALAWRMLDLTHSYGLPVDMVIGTRFPSYAVRHPRKVAWVLHQHRQAYDLLTGELTDFKDRPDDDETRAKLYAIDERSLRECRSIFANSKNVANRMKKYLNIDSEPLYHPPPLHGRYRYDARGDFILSVSRLEVNKRVDLILKAVAKCKNRVPVVIVGQGPQRKELEQLSSELGIADSVKFAGFVQDTELLDLYASCGAVYYGPLDEDYGYVTLEALLSEKMVITVKDSGGVLEFIENGVTGLVATPDAGALAAAVDQWAGMPDAGRAMAQKGKQIASAITWDHVISKLTHVLRTSN